MSMEYRQIYVAVDGSKEAELALKKPLRYRNEII